MNDFDEMSREEKVDYISKLSPEQQVAIVDRLPKFKKKLLSLLAPNIYKATIVFGLLTSGKNPFKFRDYFDMLSYGLRIDSIIGNALYVPHHLDNGDLTLKIGRAGLWNAYDFRVKSISGDGNPNQNPSHFFQNTELDFFPIQEHLPNEYTDSDKETLKGILQIWTVEHIIHFTKFSISRALEYGAIEELTYEKAYEKIGDARYLESIKRLGIGEKNIYQVTPKGSTLIFPAGGGDTTPPTLDKANEMGGIFQPT